MPLNVSTGMPATDSQSIQLETIRLPLLPGRPQRTLSGINGDAMFECAKALYPWEISFYLDLLAKFARGGSMVDVGSNLGQQVVMTADMFRHCYAIEPSTINLSILEYNIANNGIRNATIFPFALSDVKGHAPLFLNTDENSGGHSLSAVHAGGGTSEFVKVRTLDELFPQVADITYLHIDAEGSDFKVLEGGRECLRRQRQRPLIQIEFAPRALARSGSSVGTLLSVMDEFNYTAAFAANRNWAPMSRTALTELFYGWKNCSGWIDLALIPPQG